VERFVSKGPLYVIAGYFLWGVLPIFWKQLESVNSVYVLGCRIVWSVVFCAVLLLLQKERFSGVRAVFHNKKEWVRLTLAGYVICITWGVFIWAVSHGHLMDSSLAYYMNPVLAILMATLVFREKLTRLQWLAVAVTLSGLLITVFRYRQIPWIALIIGGSFAVYGALKKKATADAISATFVETLMTAPLFIVVLVWMELQGNGAIGVLHGWQWLLLPAAGVVTTVPLMLFSAGVKTTAMSLTGVLMIINPTLQLLISVWLYHEEFTTTHAILFAFVWTGLALYLISGRMSADRNH
jgi:chloramphenicol-sensitive protein RarD